MSEGARGPNGLFAFHRMTRLAKMETMFCQTGGLTMMVFSGSMFNLQTENLEASVTNKTHDGATAKHGWS